MDRDSTLKARVAAWRQTISETAAALGTYAGETSEVSGPGRRIFGSRWDDAVAQVRALNRDASTTVEVSGPATMMDECDACEAAGAALARAGAIILDPNVQAEVSQGFSRTFEEDVGRRAREMAGALAAVETAREAALAAAGQDSSVSGTTKVEELVSAYALRPRGAVSTELYVGALLRDPSDEATAALNRVKNMVLGAAPCVQPEKPLHPCQAMCYAARYTVADAEARPHVDLGVPGRPSAVYDLAPLVDQKAALKYGPLASVTSGLSYKLVERLRTIRMEPPRDVESLSSDEASLDSSARIEGPLRVAFSQAITLELAPAGVESGTRWSPLAGVHSRVDAYTAACLQAVEPHVLSVPAATERVERYEAAIADGQIPSGDTNPDLIVNALVAAFSREYDALNSSEVDEVALRRLALAGGVRAADYISIAVSKVCAGLLSGRLQRVVASPQYGEIERESRATAAVLTKDIARSLRRHLTENYRPFDVGVEGDVRRREGHLAHYRRMAEVAVAAARPNCAPPSLKKYAAGFYT